MYTRIFRPLLFLMQPETVHRLIVMLLKFFFRLPLVGPLMGKFYQVKHDALKTEFLGMSFDNPVGLAAGFDKNAEVYNEFSRFGFSFVEIGTVTPEPQPGNPKPRSFRIPKDKGLINRMGFNNKGVEYAAHRLMKHAPHIIVGGNIGKNTATSNEQAVEDYVAAFNAIYEAVDYLVINLSCPNIKNLNELQDKAKTIQIINELDKQRSLKEERKPILLKISPDLSWSEIDDAMDIFYRTGIDGLIATNTTVKRDHLNTSADSIQAIGNGGLSGAPITARSTEIIRYISRQSKEEIPIIGVGGIMTPEDALEKLEAGATLIQVYTGFIYNGPGFVKEINKAIRKQRVSRKSS